MAQQEEGQAGPLFYDETIQGVNIPGNQGKAVMVGAVPQEPSKGGIVYLGVRRAAVPPEVHGPYLYAFGVKPAGKPFITKGMLRHAVDNL
jgi:hypothetical protein